MEIQMGRTAGWWLQDTALPDGQIFQTASSGIVTAGTVAINRDGLGLYNVTAAASQTVTMGFNLGHILRFGMQDDEQQAFGSASGTGQQGLPTPPNTFATNLQQSGRPPFTIAQNQVVPANRPKGIGVLSVTPIYTVSTLAATSVSIGVTKTVFANGVAPAVTALLAAAANGQPIATSAQPNAVASALTTVTPIIDVNAEIIAEFSLVLPATSTAKIYGMRWSVQFNYN
jgi:hypothetical protein